MKKRIFYSSIIISIIILIIIGFMLSGYGQQHNSIANRIIRLHIIANSDSPEDQLLKIKIRDKIFDNVGSKLNNAVDIDMSRKIVIENLGKIEEIAEDEIKKNNKAYKAKAFLENDNFPSKKYGDVFLPAGEYEALKVVIGDGQGQNWWCVMFPPLCFVDITHGTIDENAAKNIQDISLSDKSTDINTMNVDFKFVEIWNESKTTVARIFSFLKTEN